MGKEDQIENRNYPRAKTVFEVIYALNLDSGLQNAISRDFSATGMSFSVDEPLTAGSMINIELRLNDIDKTIKTKAIVVRSWKESNDQYVSVHFFDINYHDFITLLDYSLTFQIE